MVYYTYKGKVVKIVDADTVDVNLDLGFDISKKVRCRLAGIDAPELNTTAGKEAKAFLVAQLPVGADVSIGSKEYDKYGRSVADIYYGGKLVNQMLLDAGHAVVYKG